MWEHDYLQKLANKHHLNYEEQLSRFVIEMNSLFKKELELKSAISFIKPEAKITLKSEAEIELSSARFVHKINQALSTYISESETFFLGEDICDPYGGVLKLTKGMSDAMPDQVFNTPISESGIIGFAAGLSVGKASPICEIMFGDFLALASDQIINHVAKLHYLNPENAPSVIIRTPVGGGRGYGATHSQNLEKIFGGINGIHIFIFPLSTITNGPLIKLPG